MFKNFFFKKHGAGSDDLTLSYKICRDITKSKAKNFYYCFQILPNNLKRSIYALYAFCRYCDDIADSNSSQSHKTQALNDVKKHLKNYSNHKYIYPALYDSIDKFSIPKEFKNLIGSKNIISRHASAYLKRRNINKDDILKYNIGYCEYGPYADRIVIPSYNSKGILNYFTSIVPN